MIRLPPQLASIATIAILSLAIGGSLFAQPTDGGGGRGRRGGFGDPGAFFDRLDQDENGELSGDEIENSPDFVRGRLEEMEGDGPVTRDRYVESAAEFGRGPRRGGRDREGGGEKKPDDPPKAVPKKEDKKPTERVSRLLPDQYKVFDKNRDNQIGLYEWERGKLAEFVTLDRNRDGFLTAAELLFKAKPMVNTTVLIGGGASTVVAPGPPAAMISVAGGSDSGVVPVAIATTREGQEGTRIFGLIDNNSNGLIDPDEWARSKGVRPLFERAKLGAAPPIDLATFVPMFVKAKEFEASEKAAAAPAGIDPAPPMPVSAQPIPAKSVSDDAGSVKPAADKPASDNDVPAARAEGSRETSG